MRRGEDEASRAPLAASAELDPSPPHWCASAMRPPACGSSGRRPQATDGSGFEARGDRRYQLGSPRLTDLAEKLVGQLQRRQSTSQ